LASALDAAREGRSAAARRDARVALRGGDAKTTAIAAAIAVAPTMASAIRGRVSRRRWAADVSR
jgi:hypothetical protein